MDTLRRFVALLAVAAACPGCDGRPEPAGERPPNVVLIVMDTVRADRCSFLGHPRPTTPTLDELARESVVYEDVWSPSCWTAPAHASLFTGLRPEHHGLRGANRHFLDEGFTTLAERLRDAGYRTGS